MYWEELDLNRHNNRKNLIFPAVILLVLLLLTGCQNGSEPKTEDPTETSQKENLIVVGVSQVGSESVWRTANTASVQQVFTKENGYFLNFDNARQKQENQIKAIRSYISQKVDYIVFSPIMEDGWDTVLQEAKEADIPVILMDRQVNVKDNSLYKAWVGSDFEKEGEEAGKWLESYLTAQGKEKEPIRIVVLQGTLGASSETGRTQGFHNIASGHKEWQILKQVDAEYTTAKGKEEMRRMLEEFDQIDVVVSQNDDMTFGAIEAIKEAGLIPGEDIILISFDAVKSALQLVKDGVISVDIECNPLQAPYVESVIRELEAGKQVERFCYVPEKVFTKENVKEYINDRTY